MNAGRDPAREDRNVLQLRAFATPQQADAAGAQLRAVAGVRHITVGASTLEGSVVLTGDVAADVVDDVLSVLDDLGFGPDDVTLWRTTGIQPWAWQRRSADLRPDAAVWAEIASRAAGHSRLAGIYVLYMVASGVIAGVGVLTGSSILVVGAMALSPDLLPISAAAVGLLERRWRLMTRALATLVAGMTVAIIAAAATTFVLRLTHRIDENLDLADSVLGPSLTKVGPGSVLVALAAGMAGMLAYETAGSAAVGVAISVTTIPAAAYAGVAAGLGGSQDGVGALGVLATNIVAIQAACATTLWIQRRRATRRHGA
jgi:uncharacterized hydrophobic protein (TIGR00271 family)